VTPLVKGHLAMLIFSALVAGSFSLGSMAANEIAPVALNALRFWLASALIFVAVVATGGRLHVVTHASWRYLVLGSIFSVYFVLMFEGLKTAPPVSTSAVFTLTPLLAGLFGWILLRQIMTPRTAFALMIGATGALWVIFRADILALTSFKVGRGEAIYFIGCVSHAIYTPMVRRLNRGEPALIFTFGVLVAGAIILTIYGWSDILKTSWLELPSIVWVTIVYVSACASAATFVLLQYASLRLPSAKVMAYTYLTPSWVIVWEIALGNEVPNALAFIGIGLTIVALLMLLRDEEKLTD
jgi:drug/metabolite transporter (DMT)-like permease